jgi:glycerate dehydrogenase
MLLHFSNLKGYSTESVAEFIFAAILEHARGLEEGRRRGKVGNVSEAGISAIELKNKIFGIIGLGTIGQRVAEIALGFGADVRYFSRTRKKNLEKKGVKYEPLTKLISHTDILSINLAQTKETEGIFNKKILQKIKSGTIIINTAPMELVNIDALEERLRKKDITFILDHSDEINEKDLRTLLKYQNCIIYPPIAYVSKEAAENKRRIAVENAEAFLKGKPQNVVEAL